MSAEKPKKPTANKKRKSPILSKDLLSSGATLIDLAVSGKSSGAFCKGKYYLFVGESESGKTWLAMNTLAEASINPEFKDYRLILANAEDGVLMDIESYFGKNLAKRLEIEKPSSLEDFYFTLDDDVKKETPFIKVLDSMDAIDAKADEEKFQKQKKAFRKGKVEAGSYGTAKARANSAGMRSARNGLAKTGSILIVISQSRDMIQQGPFASYGGPKKTRSGGHALKFYNTAELWFSIKGAIKKEVSRKKRELGSTLRVQVKKDRQTGRHFGVDINFYPDVGIDDVGSMVGFLIEEGHWQGSEVKVKAPEFEYEGRIEDLIKHIEKSGLEGDLKSITTEVWNDIQNACSVERKKRY